MRRTLSVKTLVLILCCLLLAGEILIPPALAGEIPNPPISQPQVFTDEEPTPTPTPTTDDVAATPAVSESLTEAALEILAILPALF